MSLAWFRSLKRKRGEEKENKHKRGEIYDKNKSNQRNSALDAEGSAGRRNVRMKTAVEHAHVTQTSKVHQQRMAHLKDEELHVHDEEEHTRKPRDGQQVPHFLQNKKSVSVT